MDSFEKFIVGENEKFRELICVHICEQDKCPLDAKTVVSCNECMGKVANTIIK